MIGIYSRALLPDSDASRETLRVQSGIHSKQSGDATRNDTEEAGKHELLGQCDTVQTPGLRASCSCWEKYEGLSRFREAHDLSGHKADDTVDMMHTSTLKRALQTTISPIHMKEMLDIIGRDIVLVTS